MTIPNSIEPTTTITLPGNTAAFEVRLEVTPKVAPIMSWDALVDEADRLGYRLVRKNPIGGPDV